jgi:hypothetical protein
MVTEFGPLFRTTGHKVKTHGITLSSGLKLGDLKSSNTSQTRQDLVTWSLMLASPTIESEVAQLTSKSTALSHTLTHLTPRSTKPLNKYRNTYANNYSISFLPAITSTSARMHGEFLRLLFLQAHRENEAYFAFMGTPAQPDQDQFRVRRAAFYYSLKSKVGGLIAANAAALRVNMNTDSCLIASLAVSRHLASSHPSSLFHSSRTPTLPRPRNLCVGWTLRHTSCGPSCFIAQLANFTIYLRTSAIA